MNARSICRWAGWLVLSWAGWGVATAGTHIDARVDGNEAQTVARGRYLVRAGDCRACHTAGHAPAYAGGRAVPTPFGVIYSTNITPDPDTGIGRWDADDFYRAMHDGIDRQGRHLYPAFPYPWYTKLSRDDVLAIKAYLDTLAPVRQRNREPDLPWPMSSRGVMAMWNALYFDAGAFQSDPRRSAAWNRGAYLVHGLGHCGACHTDKNFAGAADTDHPLRGGFGEHAFAPSLAGGQRDGLGRWSVEDIAAYLGTGANRVTSAAGPMREVVEQSTQYLTEDDLRDVAVYLKSLPAPDARQARPLGQDDERMTRGAGLYKDQCEGCHMAGGTGLAHVFPPLKGSSAIQAEHADTLIGVILQGASAPATHGAPSGLSMPAFGDKLDDRDIATLVTYIRNAWGNAADTVSPDDVHDLRQSLREAPN